MEDILIETNGDYTPSMVIEFNIPVQKQSLIAIENSTYKRRSISYLIQADFETNIKSIFNLYVLQVGAQK